MFNAYLNPEHPPGITPTRRPAIAGSTFSSAMNFRTSTAARSVRVRVMDSGFWVVVMSIPPSANNLNRGGRGRKRAGGRARTKADEGGQGRTRAEQAG